MKKIGHLETHELILTTKSPVFIGSGAEYNKKEYYYDRAHGQVHFLNMPALMSLLINKGLIDQYESYMLNSNDDLYHFFLKAKISKQELSVITEYIAKVGDALIENKALAGIQQFIRDHNGRPYIPGSSLKGCLRTVILWKMIFDNKIDVPDNFQINDIENFYLHTLNLNTNTQDLINSVMRSISISDGESIDPQRMILTKKIDVTVKGIKKDVPTIREAISPGTTTRFIMTIDKSISSGLDIDYIIKAIAEYGRYYNDTFQKSFSLPPESIRESFENCIVLGGGSGYFGKSIMYPLLGKAKAVKQVSAIMIHEYGNHHHEKDIALGISPHMLKHTKYQNRYYHYGVCQIAIN